MKKREGQTKERVVSLAEMLDQAIAKVDRAAGARDNPPQLDVAPEPDLDETTGPEPLPPWPVDAFPGPYAELVHAVAEAFDVPVEIPSACLMACASACLGRVRLVSPKADWLEPMVLWIAIVAPTGTGKSPVLQYFLRPIWQIDKEWEDTYSQEKEAHELEMERWRKAKDMDKGPAPAPPARRQVVAEDSTIEAVSDVLAQNPRGVLWCRDELSGLLVDLDRYAPTRGGSKARLLSSYDAGPWRVNRINRQSFLIPHAAISILGSIQPSILPAAFSNRDVASGFLPRFQFVFAQWAQPPAWSEKTVPSDLQQLWKYSVRHLLSLDFGGENRDQPGKIHLSPGAKEAFVKWHDRVAAMPWTHADGAVLMPFTSKMRARALRFALLLHELSCCLDHKHDCQTPIAADTMRRALTLADVCIAHQAHALMFVKGKEVLPPAPLHLRVAEAIVALRDEVQRGHLPTARIVNHLNNGSDERFQVKADAVGKSVKHLGLHTASVRYSGQKARCVRVTADDLTRLSAMITAAGGAAPPVPPVPPVPILDVERDCSRNRCEATRSTRSASSTEPGTGGTPKNLVFRPETRMAPSNGTGGTPGTPSEGAKWKSSRATGEPVLRTESKPRVLRTETTEVEALSEKATDLCGSCLHARDGGPTARHVCGAPKPPLGRYVRRAIDNCPAYEEWSF